MPDARKPAGSPPVTAGRRGHLTVLAARTWKLCPETVPMLNTRDRGSTTCGDSLGDGRRDADRGRGGEI